MKAQAHFVKNTPGQICLLLEGEANESDSLQLLRESLMSLVTVVRERPCKLAPLSVVVLRFSILHDMALRFVSKSTFTPEEIAASQQMEPALESLLRSIKVNESVITSMRVNEISDHAVFADLAQDEEKMLKCAAAFGIHQSDHSDFPRQREMAMLLGAWRQARTQSEVKLTVDATAKAHGEPVSMLAMDWNSLMTQYKAKFGADLYEEDLPAQSYFEEFEERLAEDNSRPSG